MIFKGNKRIFDSAIEESSESTALNRKINILGFNSDINEIENVPINIISIFNGVSGETTLQLNNNDNLKFPIYFLNSTELAIISPNYNNWVYKNQIYTVYYKSNFNGFICIPPNINMNINNDTLYLPSGILSLTNSSTTEEITTAFGGVENLKGFRNAIINNKKIVISNSAENKGYQCDVINSTYYKKNGDFFTCTYYDLETKSIKSKAMYNEYFRIELVYKYSSTIVTSDRSTHKVLTFGQSSSSIISDDTFSRCITSEYDFGAINEININNMVSIPIGSGCDYYGETPPERFLVADGSAISRTDYSELFEVIGTSYGTGDGTTTFNLPNKTGITTGIYIIRAK